MNSYRRQILRPMPSLLLLRCCIEQHSQEKQATSEHACPPRQMQSCVGEPDRQPDFVALEGRVPSKNELLPVVGPGFCGYLLAFLQESLRFSHGIDTAALACQDEKLLGRKGCGVQA